MSTLYGRRLNIGREKLSLLAKIARHDFFVACERKRISGRRLSPPGRREATTGDTSAFAGYKKSATLTGNNLCDPSLQPNFIP